MTTAVKDKSAYQGLRTFLIPLLILLLSFALRVWHLDAQALTGDEAFSIINWTRTTLAWLLSDIAFRDPQPPVALLSLYGWVRLVGDTVFAARMLSALAGTVAVAACYMLATQLLGRQAGYIAAFTAAINPFLVWHSQDLRTYGLWIGLSALTLTALVRALKHPSTANWVLYVALAALSAYTYYLEAFLLIAHNIYALSHIATNRRYVIPWVLSQLSIGLILAPWFLQPAIRQSGYQPTAGAPDILGALQTFLFGATLTPEISGFKVATPLPTLIACFIALLVTGAILYTIRAIRFNSAVLIITASLLPMMALAILAMVTQKGYFHPRYVAGSVIPVLVLISALLTPNKLEKRLSVGLRLLSLIILWGLSIASIVSYHTDPRVAKAPQWTVVTEFFNRQADNSDLILQNYPDPAFTYYYTGPVEQQTLPEGENPPTEETVMKLEQYAQRHDYIWFMPVESDAFDRDRVVATWLNANMQLISEQNIGAVRVLQYGSWDREQAEVPLLPTPMFSNIVALQGYSVTTSEELIDRGTTLYIELFWKPIANSDTSLKFYVHLIGPASDTGTPLWSQDDHHPQFGRIESTSWTNQETFPDVYHITIPSDTLPGQYWITAGLYDPDTNQRIPLVGGTNPIDSDSATVLSFKLP